MRTTRKLANSMSLPKTLCKKMKIIELLFILLVLSCSKTEKTRTNSNAGDSKENSKSKITTDLIRQSEIIGELGEPLGECFEIKAVIVKPDAHVKITLGLYYLQVTHVNNRKLSEPILYRFAVSHFATENVKVANDGFDLYKLVHDKQIGSLDSDQIRELEKGYLGSKVSLIVYETGGFYGIPENQPETIPLTQDKGFSFDSQLIVLDQLK